MVAPRCLLTSVTTLCSLSHALAKMSATPSQVLRVGRLGSDKEPRTPGRSHSASVGQTESIEPGSLPVTAQSPGSSAPLQQSSTKTTTAVVEQHNPHPLSTMNIQHLPNTRTTNPLISTAEPTPRPSDRSATSILQLAFQPDPAGTGTSTSIERDSPTTTSGLDLLISPSGLLPIVTETVPSIISHENPPIPSVLMGIDNPLSHIDINTFSPLVWTMASDSDRPLITSGDAVSEIESHSLSFAPSTAATSVAETLSTAETNLIVSVLTGWSSPSQDNNLNQEAVPAAHVVPLQAQGSYQSRSTSCVHRLSSQPSATAPPIQAVDESLRSWRRVSVTGAPTTPNITPPSSGHNQMVYNEESLGALSLGALTGGEAVLVSSPMPSFSFLNQGDGDRHIPSTSFSQSKSLAKTKEICDSGSSATSPTTPRTESRTTPTSTSMNMGPENPEIATGTPTTPDGPDRRPSPTTASGTATRSVDTDSMFDQLRRAQPISRQSVAVSAGAASAGTAFFILTFALHRCVHRWAGRRRTGVIWIGHEPNSDTGSRVELVSRRSQNPEVSYFSDGS